MTWHPLDTWIVVTGALCAAACALPGCYLVLRRLSMMGDAISHAVLPGLALAFIWTGSRASLPMFIGAVLVGLLTAWASQSIQDHGRLESGAAMGVVFTLLFAAGLLLIVQAADKVDLDPGCVLYGALELVPLDTQVWFGWRVPRAVPPLLLIFLLNGGIILVFYKELLVTAFDPGFANTMGIRARRMHYLLMTQVAVTTVAAFESVGSILVIAMLVGPAAIAFLLTERLKVMLILSVVIGALCAVFGHLGALVVPGWLGMTGKATNTAGMMAVVCGGLFLLALVASPRQGLILRWRQRLGLSQEVLRDDLMAMLYRLEEAVGQPVRVPAREVLATLEISAWRLRLALWRLTRAGQVTQDGAGIGMTPAGRDAARGLIRSHRLWESYMDRYTSTPSDHLHFPADRLEHITDRDLQARLAANLASTPKDPQGKAIPPA